MLVSERKTFSLNLSSYSQKLTEHLEHGTLIMLINVMINRSHFLCNLSKTSSPAALPQNRIRSMALMMMEFSCSATKNTQLTRKTQFTEAKADVDKNERIGVGVEGQSLKKLKRKVNMQDRYIYLTILCKCFQPEALFQIHISITGKLLILTVLYFSLYFISQVLNTVLLSSACSAL